MLNSKRIGNFLILLSLSVLTFIYLPIIRIYLFPPHISKTPHDGFYITIPKISAQAPIIENVDPFNPTEYEQKLKLGVAQAKGTSLPGEKGTFYIFAHSSGAPWDLSRYNTVFFRLGELKNGDEIVVNKNKKTYRYKVTDKKIVSPTEIQYLQSKDNVLIVQTCYPIGTSLKRLLIFARPT